jgi:hypothetical protein
MKLHELFGVWEVDKREPRSSERRGALTIDLK